MPLATRSTPRRTARGSARCTARRGARARRGRRCVHSCAPTSATICCARMSSGSCGQLDRVEPAGRAPRRAARRTRPARRASAGTGAPSACRRGVWFERPTRCRNVAMLRGEPIWHTSSTGPMSMPSSSDAVATSAAQVAGAQPASRPGGGGPSTGCRGARRRRRRPAARRAGARAARPAGGC